MLCRLILSQCDFSTYSGNKNTQYTWSRWWFLPLKYLQRGNLFVTVHNFTMWVSCFYSSFWLKLHNLLSAKVVQERKEVNSQSKALISWRLFSLLQVYISALNPRHHQKTLRLHFISIVLSCHIWEDVFWDSDLISELWAENFPGKILAETSENKFGSLPACEFKQLKDKIKCSDL